MQQWEYLQCRVKDGTWYETGGHEERIPGRYGKGGWYNLTPILNRLGLEGWELVVEDSGVTWGFVFERPRQ
jgi:hypothetical protein